MFVHIFQTKSRGSAALKLVLFLFRMQYVSVIIIIEHRTRKHIIIFQTAHEEKYLKNYFQDIDCDVQNNWFNEMTEGNINKHG